MIRKTGYTRIKKRQPKQNQGKLYNVIRDKTQIPDDYILMSLGIHSYKKIHFVFTAIALRKK